MVDKIVYTDNVKQCWNDGYLAYATNKGVLCGQDLCCKYREERSDYCLCMRWRKKDVKELFAWKKSIEDKVEE